MSKKIASYLSLVIALFLAVFVVIFFTWVQNHAYTLVWLLCVIGCIVWLVMAALPRPIEFDEESHKFPDSEFRG
jgi:hypothetical protein